MCRTPCDPIPTRSWALFKAKDMLRELIRAEIRASQLGVVTLAERYNISRATAAQCVA